MRMSQPSQAALGELHHHVVAQAAIMRQFNPLRRRCEALSITFLDGILVFLGPPT